MPRKNRKTRKNRKKKGHSLYSRLSGVISRAMSRAMSRGLAPRASAARASAPRSSASRASAPRTNNLGKKKVSEKRKRTRNEEEAETKKGKINGNEEVDEKKKEICLVCLESLYKPNNELIMLICETYLNHVKQNPDTFKLISGHVYHKECMERPIEDHNSSNNNWRTKTHKTCMFDNSFIFKKESFLLPKTIVIEKIIKYETDKLKEAKRQFEELKTQRR